MISNELIHAALQVAEQQYGHRGSAKARQLHAAVLLRRAAAELGRALLDSGADIDAIVAEAYDSYPSKAELLAAVVGRDD